MKTMFFPKLYFSRPKSQEIDGTSAEDIETRFMLLDDVKRFTTKRSTPGHEFRRSEKVNE